MIIWKADLIFYDQVNDRKQELQFDFPGLYKYSQLYDNLKILFTSIGWDNFRYDRYKIDFKLLTYRDKPVDVQDWNKYILNRDQIEIVISNPDLISYSLYTERGDVLLTTSKLANIYSDININSLNQVLKIYMVNRSRTKRKLIDVIINSKMLYNQMVNRLIHDYYERFLIKI